MRYVGRLNEWNDDRGFGFVTPNGGGERVFVHIKAFGRAGSRPVVGSLLSYELSRDGKGRPNAISVRPATMTKRRDMRKASTSAPGRTRSVIAAVFFGVLALGALLAKIPVTVLLVYAAMSAFAMLLYGVDKSAAQNNRWRTQESTLHVVALLGGWPGALFAQGRFRHKSRKTSFQVGFWITVLANCVALAWALSTGGLDALDGTLLGFGVD